MKKTLPLIAAAIVGAFVSQVITSSLQLHAQTQETGIPTTQPDPDLATWNQHLLDHPRAHLVCVTGRTREQIETELSTCAGMGMIPRVTYSKGENTFIIMTK